MITPEQRAIFERGKKAALSLLPQIEYLEKVSLAIPDIQESVSSLRTRRDYLLQMCEACIAAADGIKSDE